MKALVTGGGGFLGGAVVRQLVERGHSVRNFSRSAHPAHGALGVEHHGGDLGDAAAVGAACAGIDVVFHCAAKPSPWGRPEEYDRTNVEGTKNVVAACKAASVGALVYTSTPSVVASDHDIEGGDETLPYALEHFAHYPRTKAIAEQWVLAAAREGLAAVALRPHLVYGPGDPHFLPRFISKRRAGRLRRIGSGDPLVDVTYVDDAAAAHLAAAERLLSGAPISGRAYFVTSGTPVGVWTMVDRMLACADLPPVDRRVSPSFAAFAARVAEWVWRTFDRAGEPPITRFAVQQLVHAHWFSIEAAQRDLQWAPQVGLDEGLRRVRAALSSG